MKKKDDDLTVFVVDDDAAVREALILVMRSVGLAVEGYVSAEDFLSAYDPRRPGCLVLDVRMPGMSGLSLQERLAARGIDLPIIFITGHADVRMSVRAMKGQAYEFLEKPFNDQELLDQIHKCLIRVVRTRQERDATAEVAARIASLTGRERAVLQGLVEGKANKVIAVELGISEKTVESHRARLMKKMAVRSFAALIRKALKAGMDPDKQVGA